MKWASIPKAGAPWYGLILDTSGRPRWKPCWVTPPRPARSSGGRPKSASPNWWRRWSNQTWTWRSAMPWSPKKATKSTTTTSRTAVQLNQDSRIYVAGHRGLVGAAVVRALQQQGYRNLLLRTHQELDLTEQTAVREFFDRERPAAVIMAAARVGGIHANNSRPALFIRDNLLIQDNVIDAAHRSGISKFVFLGSSCIYPKLAPQPIKEEYLLTGPLEPTNEWYAIAKIAGIKMCQAHRQQYGFRAISLMPTNLYGPEDNFDLQSSHVLPALIRKAHEARMRRAPEMVVWGSGTPRREFMHVDDMADAAVFLMLHYDEAEIINVGVGSDVS